MITRRALLLYNFGIAVILIVVGIVSVFAVGVVQAPSRVTDMPTFDRAAHKSLEEHKDIEPLRARALFYFELARDLKRERSLDTARLFYDARTLAFMVAGLFALGGVMILVLPLGGAKEEKS